MAAFHPQNALVRGLSLTGLKSISVYQSSSSTNARMIAPSQNLVIHRWRAFSPTAPATQFRRDWTLTGDQHLPLSVQPPPTARIFLQPVTFTLATPALDVVPGTLVIELEPVAFTLALPGMELFGGQLALLQPVTFTLATPALDVVPGTLVIELEPVAFTLATPGLILEAPLIAMLEPVVFTLAPQTLQPIGGLLVVELEPVAFRLRPISGTLSFPGVPIALPFPPRPSPPLPLPMRMLRRSFHLLLTLSGTALELPAAQITVQLRAPQTVLDPVNPNPPMQYERTFRSTNANSIRNEWQNAVFSQSHQQTITGVAGFRDPVRGYNRTDTTSWNRTKTFSAEHGTSVQIVHRTEHQHESLAGRSGYAKTILVSMGPEGRKTSNTTTRTNEQRRVLIHGNGTIRTETVNSTQQENTTASDSAPTSSVVKERKVTSVYQRPADVPDKAPVTPDPTLPDPTPQIVDELRATIPAGLTALTQIAALLSQSPTISLVQRLHLTDGTVLQTQLFGGAYISLERARSAQGMMLTLTAQRPSVPHYDRAHVIPAITWQGALNEPLKASCALGADLVLPGDTIEVETGVSFVVREVQVSISPRDARMELMK